jgi:hypothetical protein
MTGSGEGAENNAIVQWYDGKTTVGSDIRVY